MQGHSVTRPRLSAPGLPVVEWEEGLLGLLNVVRRVPGINGANQGRSSPCSAPPLPGLEAPGRQGAWLLIQRPRDGRVRPASLKELLSLQPETCPRRDVDPHASPSHLTSRRTKYQPHFY